MADCYICLRPLPPAAQDYHPTCLRALFGTRTLPELDVDLNTLSDIAVKMAGRMSISGVQQKVLVSLSPDRHRIEFAPTGGRYILKPPINTFPEIPANEHLTMQLAPLVNIDTPRNGLVALRDGNLAYIVRRFDRLEDGSKLQQEDFCQVAGLPPAAKYDASSELCVRLLRQHASEPLIAVLALYRLMLFSWCVGNGDLHLKNISLLTGPDGIRQLSPAYDLVNTRLAIRDDRIALSIGGKQDHLRRGDWLRFGEYCAIPRRTVERVIALQLSQTDGMVERIRRSHLSRDRQRDYEQVVRGNIAALSAG